jgi:hypothetical protein
MGTRRPPLTGRVVRGLLDVIIHAEAQCEDQENEEDGEDAMHDKAETADMRRALEYLSALRYWHKQKPKGGE